MQAAELLNHLQMHKGRRSGIKCATLAAQAGITERQARKLISDLRFDGCAVVGTPESGYYLADSADEVTEFTEFHRESLIRKQQSRCSLCPLWLKIFYNLSNCIKIFFHNII